MTKNKKKQIADPRTQIVVQLPVADKNRWAQAAKKAGHRNLSAFVRAVLDERAEQVLGNEATPPSKHSPKRGGMLHVYVGDTVPEHAVLPAISVPSVRSFATAFSDRNRRVLRYLTQQTPDSIHDLAQALDYPYEQLARHLGRLTGYGLIAYEPGPGPQLVPQLLVDGVELLVPLRGKAPKTFMRCALHSEPDEPTIPDPDRVFTSIDEFAASLPGQALQVLQTIAAQSPDSTVALAKLLDTDLDYLYRPLHLLQSLGLIAMTGMRPQRPVLIADGLALEIVFRE